jgi:hypothetical protein
MMVMPEMVAVPPPKNISFPAPTTNAADDKDDIQSRQPSAPLSPLSFGSIRQLMKADDISQHPTFG